MSFVEVVELFLKSKFVFIITCVNNYRKSVIKFVELCRSLSCIFCDSRLSVLMLFLQSVICLFTRSCLYSKVLLYL